MSERVKRPEPDRTDPIRSGWLDLFGISTGSRQNDGQASSENGQGKPLSSDPVTRAVELGYRVVDDYLRQGQQVARSISDRGRSPLPLTGDVQDLMTRWFQYTSELTEVWFQLVGLAASGQMPRGAAGPAEPAPPTTADGSGSAGTDPGAPPESARVAVAVLCGRPVEVTVDLRPIPAEHTICVHDLRAVDPDKPRISDVAVERVADGGGLQLRIQIPDDQPSGTYSGLVLNEDTSLPAGTVAVRIP